MGRAETPIQSAIFDALKRHFPEKEGFGLTRRNVVKGMFMRPDGGPRYIEAGIPGEPDLQIFHRGTLAGIEVKTADSTLSPKQRKYRAWFERNGGCYIVARSVDDALDGLVAAGILRRHQDGSISRIDD
jgi:hypothetical protein